MPGQAARAAADRGQKRRYRGPGSPDDPWFRRRFRIRHHGALGQELPGHLYTCFAGRKTALYDGIRFGGTLTLDDAWNLGFDHVCIATGGRQADPGADEEQPHARRPAGVGFPDGSAGHRRWKGDSSPNCNTASRGRDRRRPYGNRYGGPSLMAYYPAQVTKIKQRYDGLCAYSWQGNRRRDVR